VGFISDHNDKYTVSSIITWKELVWSV